MLKSPTLTLVSDPYLSTTLEEATKDQREKRHVRMMDIPLFGDQLLQVDYLLISHNHRDHYDRATVAAILSTNPRCTLIAPRVMEAQLRREHHCSLVAMDHGTTWRDGAVHIEALKAKHNQYDHTPEGGYPYLSYGIEVDGRKVFFAGDTIPHAPLDTFLRQWAADLAFLPINGCTEELLAKGFASNLSYQEAIALSSSSHVRWTVPCHYDMFTINTEQVGKFVNEANRVGLPYIVPTIGQEFTLDGEGGMRWK